MAAPKAGRGKWRIRITAMRKGVIFKGRDPIFPPATFLVNDLEK
jgi:hypothetical protein